MRKRLLVVSVVYYVAAMLVFQIILRLSSMRGRPAFGSDEMPLAFTSAIVPMAPLVWLATRLLDCLSVVRRESQLSEEGG